MLTPIPKLLLQLISDWNPALDLCGERTRVVRSHLTVTTDALDLYNVRTRVVRSHFTLREMWCNFPSSFITEIKSINCYRVFQSLNSWRCIYGIGVDVVCLQATFDAWKASIIYHYRILQCPKVKSEQCLCCLAGLIKALFFICRDQYNLFT